MIAHPGRTLPRDQQVGGGTGSGRLPGVERRDRLERWHDRGFRGAPGRSHRGPGRRGAGRPREPNRLDAAVEEGTLSTDPDRERRWANCVGTPRGRERPRTPVSASAAVRSGLMLPASRRSTRRRDVVPRRAGPGGNHEDRLHQPRSVVSANRCAPASPSVEPSSASTMVFWGARPSRAVASSSSAAVSDALPARSGARQVRAAATTGALALGPDPGAHHVELVPGRGGRPPPPRSRAPRGPTPPDRPPPRSPACREGAVGLLACDSLRHLSRGVSLRRPPLSSSAEGEAPPRAEHRQSEGQRRRQEERRGKHRGLDHWITRAPPRRNLQSC